MLGSVEPKFWRAFCEAAGRPEWTDRHCDPIPQVELTAEVARFFRGLTLSETLGRFIDADCCLSPVLDLGEALASTHIRSRGLVRAGVGGDELQALFPAYVDGEPPRPRARLRANHSDGSVICALGK